MYVGTLYSFKGVVYMDKRREVFFDFVDSLVNVTHVPNDFDRVSYVQLIKEICEFYNLSKGVAEFYRNRTMERNGDGEYFCDYDNGHADKIAHRIRIESKSNAIIVGTVYMAEDAEPLSDDDRYCVNFLLGLILSFISRRRLQTVIEQFGFFDESGYPNYRSFGRFLDVVNADGKLVGRYAFHLDLHNFTMVNQEIGRQNGDTVLWNYFEMLRGAIGDEGIICRLGGDKFVGMFSEDRKDLVMDILKGTSVSYGEDGYKRINISAAVGIYQIPPTFFMNSTGDIMDKAIIPSMIAKRQDEGAVVFYDIKMKNDRERMKQIQHKFREGLHNEEFKVYYQPKVDIETDEIIGAEALCRWVRDGKVIPPMEFIPILEQNMDICDLDFYMLDYTCRDIHRWMQEGKNIVRVSVNLSRKHLVDANLLEHIMEVIDRHAIPHKYIEIELTETTTDVQFRDLKRVVAGLREQGVWTAVDDFGMGYSSLNLIREIPWDVLKIDKCFLPVEGDAENEITSIMFKHVAALAQDMGMRCVVEGVETEDQLDILRENNCHIAQGFLYDRPLPVEEFEARLAKKHY